MTTLKDARKKGPKGLEKFIREHEADEAGDMERMNKALKRPVSEKTKQAPKTSPPAGRDD